jgi:hypothetical protein
MNAAQPKSSNWKAWKNVMPGSKPKLHVTGDLTVPTGGYSAKLSPHTPQGINPQIYLLDLTINPPAPDQVVPQVVTTIKVQYEEKTQTNYTQVTILPTNITVDVKTVS